VRVAWERRLDQEVRTWIAWYQAESRCAVDASPSGARGGGDRAVGCWDFWRDGLPSAGEELERAVALHAATWLGRWMARFAENALAREVSARAEGRRPRPAKGGHAAKSRKKGKEARGGGAAELADLLSGTAGGGTAGGGIAGGLEGRSGGWIIDRRDPATVTRLLHDSRLASRGRVQRAFAETFLLRGVETDQELALGKMALAAGFDRRRVEEPAHTDLRHLRHRDGKAIRRLRLAAGLV
jgi:hypothetical protein